MPCLPLKRNPSRTSSPTIARSGLVKVVSAHESARDRVPDQARRPLIGQPYSGLMFANFTTLPHFSVSPTTSRAKSAAESDSGVSPRSAKRDFILGSARPALISLLSFSVISAGEALRPTPPTPPRALG